jgi:hypothetical protein
MRKVSGREYSEVAKWILPCRLLYLYSKEIEQLIKIHYELLSKVCQTNLGGNPISVDDNDEIYCSQDYDR